MRRALVVAIVASGCGDQAGSNPSPPPVSTPQPQTVELLRAMATLVGDVPPAKTLDAWAAKLDGKHADLGSYVDEILTSERFPREVIPTLVFGAFGSVRNYYALPAGFVLRGGGEPGAPLYLRAPCKPEDATRVRPWWALGTEILVCEDAYRPNKWTVTGDDKNSYQTKTMLSCDSMVGSPELETSPLCGCGPNLIRCLRDEQHYHELNRSLMDEVKQTTAYVVEHDLPIESLFTTNSTYRDRNVELYYRRQKINANHIQDVAAELTDLSTWPESGRWAPREELRPGQHAGLLTAPQILHWLPDRRQRQRGYYEIMWCSLRNSFGATTQRVLELNQSGNNVFANESWKQLAHAEMCTNCHARLDYGFQFFAAYPDSRGSTHYVPSLHSTGTGPLYGTDIRDHRGDGPLTPLGFAKLAVAQPELADCMTDQLVDYVLGVRATPEDRATVAEAVTRHKTFKAAMKVALLQYAARWRAQTTRSASAPPSTPPITQPASRASSDKLPISPALRAVLDRLCIDCHDETPYSDVADTPALAFDLTGPELPRPLLVRATEQVAFGTMPKDKPLDPAEREQVVDLVIGTLWTDPTAQAEARRYFLGGARALPAHHIDNTVHTIERLAGASSDVTWGALERGLWSDQSTITPGFLAVTGLAALRACARANPGKPDALDACLRRATSMSTMSRWPLE